jgi:hypothetical protein
MASQVLANPTDNNGGSKLLAGAAFSDSSSSDGDSAYPSIGWSNPRAPGTVAETLSRLASSPPATKPAATVTHIGLSTPFGGVSVYVLGLPLGLQRRGRLAHRRRRRRGCRAHCRCEQRR